MVAGAAFGFALFIGASTTSHAQVRLVAPGQVEVVDAPVYQGGYFPYSYPFYQRPDPIAYQRQLGYNEGLSRGRSDARHRLPDNPMNHKHYANKTTIAYREGFERGYADGYDRLER